MTFALTVDGGSFWGGWPATLARQFGGAFAIGVPGPFDLFAPLPADTQQPPPARLMLYGQGAAAGRGFFVARAGGGRLELSCPLPTTVHDLEDLFTFAGQLAKAAGAKTLRDQQGGSIPAAGLQALYVETAQANNRLLQQTATGGPFTVSGVRLPLRLPENLCRRIGSVPAGPGEKYFSAYLADKQGHPFHYLAPRFFRDAATGTPIAAYTLRSEVQSVIPKQPFVPYGPPPFEGEAVARWLVAFPGDGGAALGPVDYTVFYQRLGEEMLAPFDEEHVYLRPLAPRRIAELLAP